MARHDRRMVREPTGERAGGDHPEADLFGESEHASNRRLLLAALDTFAEFGYHGTTTRDIVRRAGVSTGGMYIHYDSKQALLERISRAAHAGMLERMRQAAALGGSPTERLSRVVQAHVRFHAHYNTSCRVANYELHSLTPANLEAMRKLRRGMEEVVAEILEAGVASGEFVVGDSRLATMFVVSLGIDVSRWFRPGHRLTPEQVAVQYAELVHHALAATGERAGGTTSKRSSPRRRQSMKPG